MAQASESLRLRLPSDWVARHAANTVGCWRRPRHYHPRLDTDCRGRADSVPLSSCHRRLLPWVWRNAGYASSRSRRPGHGVATPSMDSASGCAGDPHRDLPRFLSSSLDGVVTTSGIRTPSRSRQFVCWSRAVGPAYGGGPDSRAVRIGPARETIRVRNAQVWRCSLEVS